MKLALVLCISLLSACTSTLVDYETRTHIVQPGETLYTIAWRHGVDHRALASWNGLTNPDLIFVGQRIRLSAQAPAAGNRRVAATAPRPASSVSAAPEPVLPPPRWQWPTQGAVISQFGTSGGIASGIGIGGRAGQPVNAAAKGRVVYAGSGLIGYGQLVIIKHNETYLSAYGHNNRLLVDQGQDVQRGQKIAEMGLGPERNPRLHFEIRRNGVPVNPAQLLSARR